MYCKCMANSHYGTACTPMCTTFNLFTYDADHLVLSHHYFWVGAKSLADQKLYILTNTIYEHKYGYDKQRL